jgi:hypothetical protein
MTSMVGFLVAFALAPWNHPLAFRPLRGWQTSTSGNTRSLYVGPGKHLRPAVESAAWIAKNVRYADDATADPPKATLAHIPSNGVIVWAVVFSRAETGQKPIRLDLSGATRFACCEPVDVRGGEYELTGAGPGRADSAIIRVYFGSRPTRASRAAAQRALDQLQRPFPR